MFYPTTVVVIVVAPEEPNTPLSPLRDGLSDRLRAGGGRTTFLNQWLPRPRPLETSKLNSLPTEAPTTPIWAVESSGFLRPNGRTPIPWPTLPSPPVPALLSAPNQSDQSPAGRWSKLSVNVASQKGDHFERTRRRLAEPSSGSPRFIWGGGGYQTCPSRVTIFREIRETLPFGKPPTPDPTTKLPKAAKSILVE